MTKSLQLILPMLLLHLCFGCTIIGYDGPYEGKIVDFDTLKPIEGAVVFGEWYRVIPTPAGAVSSYYDYKETLTDKNGNFKLNGVGFLFFSDIEKPSIGLFKAGYEQPHSTYWSDFKNKKHHPDVDVEGSKIVLKLRRMTFEQRRKRIIEIRGPGTFEKNRCIWLESNKEQIEICSDPNTLFPVDGESIKVTAEVEKFCKEFRQKEYDKHRIIVPIAGKPPSASLPSYYLKPEISSGNSH